MCHKIILVNNVNVLYMKWVSGYKFFPFWFFNYCKSEIFNTCYMYIYIQILGLYRQEWRKDMGRNENIHLDMYWIFPIPKTLVQYLYIVDVFFICIVICMVSFHWYFLVLYLQNTKMEFLVIFKMYRLPKDI